MRNLVVMLQSYANKSACVALNILNGTQQGQTINVHSEETVTIGRSSSLSVSILDPRMSRQHFSLVCTECQWRVHDLGSLNGTFVNGRPVERENLQQGDVVMAGDTKFQVAFPVGDFLPIVTPQPTVDKKASNRSTSNYDDLY